jgi:hypothetical protein
MLVNTMSFMHACMCGPRDKTIDGIFTFCLCPFKSSPFVFSPTTTQIFTVAGVFDLPLRAKQPSPSKGHG